MLYVFVLLHYLQDGEQLMDLISKPKHTQYVIIVYLFDLPFILPIFLKPHETSTNFTY